MDLEQGAMEAPLMEAEVGKEEDSSKSGRGGMRNDLVMLTEKKQLEKLARLLRNNEEPLMRQVIKSETEFVQYLKMVNDSYNQSTKLLDDCAALKDTHERSGSGSGVLQLQVARDVQDYVIYGLNMCMQTVRNCCMRVDAIGKLRAHYDALAEGLADPGADVESLATEASKYKASMWEYCRNHRSASAQANSKEYSGWLKTEGVDLPELRRRHQLKLGYRGKGEDFEDVQDTLKLKVETALSGSLKVMAAVGAFAVGVTVTRAINKAVASVATRAVAKFACSLAGFVIGAVAGLIFMAVSGALIGLFFRSPRKVPPVAELKLHTAIMPDGVSLANAIAYQPPK